MSLKLTEIDANNLETASNVLKRGFPEREDCFWFDVLNEIMRAGERGILLPIGYILLHDSAAVGVVLTLRSRRRLEGGPDRTMVNLSSWYIDEPHRWYAPMMLKRIMQDTEDIYTDLTPSESVMEMLPRLGFSQWTEGVALAVLPMAFNRFGKDVSVVPRLLLEQGELSESSRKNLEAHERAGCLTCVLKHDGRADPIILKRFSFRGVPAASIIYAPSRTRVLSNIGNICTHLLRHGIFVVEVNCNQNECPPLSIFRNRPLRKHYKGLLDADQIDYAHSELVYLEQ